MNNYNTIKYQTTEPIAPGETIIEIIKDRGITQIEFAKRLGRPTKTINEIVKGKSAITPETALQLEYVLGIPASFWNNLQSQYQEAKLRIESREKYRDLVSESRIFPYQEMAKYGWIEDTRNPLKRVENLLKFFGITSFENIVEEAKLKDAAFRISSKHRRSIPAIVAWLRKGSIDGGQINTAQFNENKARELIPKLREMTHISEPNELMTKLRDELSNCGIAFVVTRNLKNTPVNGATRWITPNKALLQMSIRWKWTDIFWFSLFHELAHVLLDNKKDFNVDFIKNNIDSESEREKEEFAKDQLISPKDYQELTYEMEKLETISGIYTVIETFSKKIGIHPGIVAGRLQHERKMPHNMNRLRRRFVWAD